MAQEDSSFPLWPFIRLDVIVDELIIAAEFPFSDDLFFEAMIVVDPIVPDDGDRDGTVETEEPGDVELEFIFLCRWCKWLGTESGLCCKWW